MQRRVLERKTPFWLVLAALACLTPSRASSFLYAQPVHKTSYHVECRPNSEVVSSDMHILHGIDAVNATTFHPGDSLVFKRGDSCPGSLSLHGSGTASQPIHIQANGAGLLPSIQATPGSDAALLVQNVSYWDIKNLALSGGRLAGLLVRADQKQEHSLHFEDLIVRDVDGLLTGKTSGLILVEGVSQGSIQDLKIDGVQAFNTSLWAGVIVMGASSETPISDVEVTNTLVHDVQGDGIVLFNVAHGSISHSVAWHTGMEQAVTIGTPNAIWTWHCTDCRVNDNEAFLVDSPGVDGGAFDIDFGNSATKVLSNFGHHTQGYCISIFAGPDSTVDSTVADNTCYANGLSPKLAARQGALFFMTWDVGHIRNASVTNNIVYWSPPGDVPAFVTGTTCACALTIAGNIVYTNVGTVFDQEIAPFATGTFMRRFPAIHKTLFTPSGMTSSSGWRLLISLPETDDQPNEAWRNDLVEVLSMSSQFSTVGLQTTLLSSTQHPSIQQVISDWSNGWHTSLSTVTLRQRPQSAVRLIAPNGVVKVAWPNIPSSPKLWLELNKWLGPPDYAKLPTKRVKAVP